MCAVDQYAFTIVPADRRVPAMVKNALRNA
jgi:hypothetical protein